MVKPCVHFVRLDYYISPSPDGKWPIDPDEGRYLVVACYYFQLRVYLMFLRL